VYGEGREYRSFHGERRRRRRRGDVVTTKVRYRSIGKHCP
jgi:hypothetical protein